MAQKVLHAEVSVRPEGHATGIRRAIEKGNVCLLDFYSGQSHGKISFYGKETTIRAIATYAIRRGMDSARNLSAHNVTAVTFCDFFALLPRKNNR
ncbi:MAG: hypothetical protein LBE81_02060 [Azonexus sp.]|uniref:hypothetical protein n=1 Tax=Azonexus sp. TaxID=1872668 RepID=UPI00282B8B69|nr:hypothetical protein [Azonexus sp.]MDR0775409.1 hypothetical protein [Azonexus sp.]